MLRIVILVVALAAGGLAAWIALTMQTSPEPVRVAAPPPPPTVEVLVAAVDLGQGQPVAEASVRWQSWPESAIGGGYIVKGKRPDAVAALSGALVRTGFVAGEPIREDKLARGVGLLASMLPSGKRAVAIRISAEATAGGFVLPNDRVDIIQTSTRPGAGNAVETASRIILSNIRVLAIDQKTDPQQGQAKDQAVTIGKTATLELDPTQAETISASQAGGMLSLALRSIADEGEEPIVTAAPEAPASVRIVRAGRSETVRVR